PQRTGHILSHPQPFLCAGVEPPPEIFSSCTHGIELKRCADPKDPARILEQGIVNFSEFSQRKIGALAGKIWVVIRIGIQTARPPSAQNCLALWVDSIGLILRVQVKPGKRRVNNPITRSPNSQAKIGISKRAPQTFIKPAGFFEDIAAREEAGGGNGTAIARHQELAIGAIALRRKAT